MKIQVHNLMKHRAFNVGIAYLHEEKAFALGLLFFSITVFWDGKGQHIDKKV